VRKCEGKREWGATGVECQSSKERERKGGSWGVEYRRKAGKGREYEAGVWEGEEW